MVAMTSDAVNRPFSLSYRVSETRSGWTVRKSRRPVSGVTAESTR